MSKQRATIDDQIRVLRAHGVAFQLMSEEAARAFLAQNTYFYKLKSYTHNYDKIPTAAGYTYRRLDFEYLVELSLIDFALSRQVWRMCSSIEHAVKIRLNNMVMDSPDPHIADKCVAQCFRGDYSAMQHDNPYTNDLRQKSGGDYAMWHLWELCSFQQQLALYDTSYQIIRGTSNPQRHILFIVRKIRNAVSHGNCLLADLHRPAPSRQQNKQADREVTTAAMKMCGRTPKNGSRLSTFQVALNTLVVNNFAAVLLAHLHYVDSPAVLEHCQHEMRSFIERVNRNRREYFGDRKAPSPRNRLVNQTLEAFVTLSEGYLQSSTAKILALQHNVTA